MGLHHIPSYALVYTADGSLFTLYHPILVTALAWSLRLVRTESMSRGPMECSIPWPFGSHVDRRAAGQWHCGVRPRRGPGGQRGSRTKPHGLAALTRGHREGTSAEAVGAGVPGGRTSAQRGPLHTDTDPERLTGNSAATRGTGRGLCESAVTEPARDASRVADTLCTVPWPFHAPRRTSRTWDAALCPEGGHQGCEWGLG